MSCVQFEQEFGLILGRSNAKQDFTSEQCTKYVPAIISYDEKSTKRVVREILHKLIKHNGAKLSVCASPIPDSGFGILSWVCVRTWLLREVYGNNNNVL